MSNEKTPRLESLDRHLIMRALDAYEASLNANTSSLNTLLEGRRIKRQRDQLHQLWEPQEFLQRGGAPLGTVRNWMQRNAYNGEDVTWGSHTDVLRLKTMTPAVLEALAADIAAATLNEFIGKRHEFAPHTEASDK